MNKIKNGRLVFLCAFVFSVLSLALPVFAQNSELEVKCADPSDAPAQNVKVVIINLNGSKPKDKKSDAKGIALFDKLDNGVYRVVGRKEGFAPSFFEFVQLKGAKESVTLKLAAGEDKKLYFEDPAIEKSAADLFVQGLQAYQQKNLADAEKFIRQSLEINPSAADALYYLGAMLLQQSKYEQGAEAMNKAAAISEIRKTLPSPAPAGKQNPYEQILQNARQQVAQIPLMKADDAFKRQKFDESAALYNEVLKANPGRADLYANLARALTQAKRNEEAMTAINKAIELKPDEKTYASLKNAISTRMENVALEKAQTLLTEGNKMLDAGDAAGALGKFQDAAKLVPAGKQSPVLRQIGRTQAKLNHPDEAIAAFKKSIELAPADKAGDYQMSFAQFYLDAKKFEEAVDIMADPKTAGSKTPEQVLVDLAAKVKNQEPRLAEAALERVIKLNPANANAHYDLGRLYFSEGKEKDARTKELLNKYVQIGTDTEKLDDAKGLLFVVNKRSK